MKKTRMIAAAAVAALSVSAFAVAASAYTGYLCFQTGAFSYRDNWDHAEHGKGSIYFDNMTMNGGTCAAGTYADYEDYYEADAGTYLIPVKWTDANITGAGTYTVAIEGFDWSLDGSTAFNAGYISTDVKEDAGLECTSLKVYADGKVIKSWDSGVKQGYNGNGNFEIYFSNPWNEDADWNKYFLGKDGEAYPTKDLKVEFTLAAAAKDGDAATTAAPTTGDTQAATDSSKGSPDTGVADVAVIGGLALAAGAGIVLTRKRK